MRRLKGIRLWPSCVCVCVYLSHTHCVNRHSYTRSILNMLKRIVHPKMIIYSSLQTFLPLMQGVLHFCESQGVSACLVCQWCKGHSHRRRTSVLCSARWDVPHARVLLAVSEIPLIGLWKISRAEKLCDCNRVCVLHNVTLVKTQSVWKHAEMYGKPFRK